MTPSSFDDPAKPTKVSPGQVTARNLVFKVEKELKNREEQKIRDQRTTRELESVGRRAAGISAQNFDEFPEFKEAVDQGYLAVHNLFRQLKNEEVDGWVYFHAIAKIIQNCNMPPIDLPEDSEDSHELLRQAYLQYAHENDLFEESLQG